MADTKKSSDADKRSVVLVDDLWEEKGTEHWQSLLNRFTHDPKRIKLFYSYTDALDRLSKAKSGDVQEIAASQIQLLKSFYDLALGQARRSFKWALVSAGVGLAFFVAAVGFLLVDRSQSIATVSLISGALVEVISGINFYLYARTTSQLGMFHLRLDFTQRLLLANSLCEGLTGENKERARSSLIAKLAGVGVGGDVNVNQEVGT